MDVPSQAHFCVLYLAPFGGVTPVTLVATLAAAKREGQSWWFNEGAQRAAGRLSVWEFPKLGAAGRWAADFDGNAWHTHERYDGWGPAPACGPA